MCKKINTHLEVVEHLNMSEDFQKGNCLKICLLSQFQYPAIAEAEFSGGSKKLGIHKFNRGTIGMVKMMTAIGDWELVRIGNLQVQ